jgi:hypothetical protein
MSHIYLLAPSGIEERTRLFPSKLIEHEQIRLEVEPLIRDCQ